jgi:hypothetical protein
VAKQVAGPVPVRVVEDLVALTVLTGSAACRADYEVMRDEVVAAAVAELARAGGRSRAVALLEAAAIHLDRADREFAAWRARPLAVAALGRAVDVLTAPAPVGAVA